MLPVTKEHLTPMLRFRVINERNFTLSTGMSFFGMPSKQGPVLGPDNRDLLQRDNTSIISVYQIPIIRATAVHL